MSNWATFIFAAGVNFFLAPFVIRSLGETQYGAWVLLGSLVGNLGLLDIGIRVAVQRYIARFHAASEHAQATRLYSTALSIFVLAGGVATVLSFIMSLLLGHVFNVPPELLGIARVVIVLGGLNVGASLIGGVFGGVLCGLERFDYNNAVEIATTTLRTAGVILVLETGQGLIGLAVVQLLATGLKIYASARMSRRLYPQLDLRAWRWDGESARMLLRYGLTASLLHVSYAIMFYSDSMVIGAYLPVAMITYFSIAGNLVDYARSVMSGVSQTLSPRLSALEASGSDSALRHATLTAARVSALVVAPIAVTFLVTGSSFIGLWMGPQYSRLSGQILTVLTVPLLVLSGYQVVSAALFGVGKHALLIPVFLAEAACNVILSIILVREYGVIGTALGTMIPRIVVSIVVGPWVAKRTLGISAGALWRWALLLPVLAMLPFGAASVLVERVSPAGNLATYFVHVLMLLPLAAVADWFVCLTAHERLAIRRMVGRLWSRKRFVVAQTPALADAGHAPVALAATAVREAE